MNCNFRLILRTLIVLCLTGLGLMSGHAGTGQIASPAAPKSAGTNSFPDPNEVFQGRAFETKFEKEVFFLRRIHDQYSIHWPSLLSANIGVNDYVSAPNKLLRFVEELGTAMADTDDSAAIGSLSLITSDPAFYANTNAYRPEILSAAAAALIKIGPKGRKALADAFTETHYRADPGSLELFADAMGQSGVSQPEFTKTLSMAAFTFTATNGGSYPRCTKELTRNLLRLPQGVSVVQSNLTAKGAFDDPGRFQAVVEGIAAAGTTALATNLLELAGKIAARLEAHPASTDPYYIDVRALHTQIERALAQLANAERKHGP